MLQLKGELTCCVLLFATNKGRVCLCILRSKLTLSLPDLAAAAAHAQGGAGLTLAARLAGQALLPDCMFPAIHAFNPHNSRPLPTANGAAPPWLLSAL
jgi:hypothetical protein